MIKLDYSQHQCPYPVVETRKQILANPGQSLEVLVGDQAGRDNVSRLATKMGYQTVAEQDDSRFLLTLTPAEGKEETATQTETAPTSASTGKTIIYCGSDRMGDGDDSDMVPLVGLLRLGPRLSALVLDRQEYFGPSGPRCLV